MKSRYLFIIVLLVLSAVFFSGRREWVGEKKLIDGSDKPAVPATQISEYPEGREEIEIPRIPEGGFRTGGENGPEKEYAESRPGEGSPAFPETPAGKEPEDERKGADADVGTGLYGYESQSVFYDVPFTSQAPFAEWDDLRQEDGCEEASVLMAVYWFRDKRLTPEIARREIIAAAEYQRENYGSYRDTSARDTVERIAGEYFGYDGAEAREISGTDEIVEELLKGNLVAVPVNGQKLGNPYYTPPGADRHNLLIIGYDAGTEEFITNDSGTRRGEKYRYAEKVLENALRDYPTGSHLPIAGSAKSMIVFGPE